MKPLDLSKYYTQDTKEIRRNNEQAYKEAMGYAIKQGALDSINGIQQIYGQLTGKGSLLDKLKEDNKKLKEIFENKEYGDDAYKAYLASAMVLDPVGWIPLAGWATKSKRLGDAAVYGAGLGGAYSALGYVGEGESRALNTVAGAGAGGVLGTGGALIARNVAKAFGKDVPKLGRTTEEVELDNLKADFALSKEGKMPTMDEVEQNAQKAVDNLVSERGNKEMSSGIEKFYRANGGDWLWDQAVKNWGSGLVGSFGAVGGYNAFDDPEATELQKMMAATLMALGGVGITKGLGKVPVGKEGEELKELLGRGLVDNYALPSKYLDYKKEAQSEVNSFRDLFSSLSKRVRANLNEDERKVFNSMITGEIDTTPDLKNLRAETRDAIKSLGQELVDAGLLDERIFLKNADTYLKRSYEKYLGGKANKEAYLAARQFKLIGDELKGRGRREIKSKFAIEKFPEKYKDVEVEDYVVAVSRKQYEKLVDALPKRRKDRLENYKLNQTVSDIRNWEKIEGGDANVVLLRSKDKVITTRQLTKQERQDLGEIEDAAFNIAETGRLMTNDLATFKLFSKISQDADLSMKADVYKAKVDSGEIRADDWELVPDTPFGGALKVEGQKIKSFGNLAGQYVPKDVYRDLKGLENLRGTGKETFELYQPLNRLWKKTKTAWNPVVHVNNTVSNLLLMNAADGSYKYLPRALKELQRGKEGGKNIEIYNLAKQNGVFDSDIVSRELNKEVVDSLDDTLKLLSRENKPETNNAIEYATQMFKNLTKKGYDMTAGKLEKLYQSEDQVFRLALFMDRLSKGMSPAEAGADAKKWFIDYDINAPIINFMRRYPTPFLAYTYRIVPLLAETAIRRPWKFAKWAVIGHSLNELGQGKIPFAELVVDPESAKFKEEIGNEEAERAVMRDYLSDNMFGLPFMPKTLVKTPFASGISERKGEEVPLYIDFKRFIPGGDVLSISDKGFGIPIPFTDKGMKLPAPLAPNFGVLGETMIPMFYGVDPFTLEKLQGEGLEDEEISKWQHILSRLIPNIPSSALTVPYFGPDNIIDKYNPLSKSYSSQKIVQAFRQNRDNLSKQYGTEFSPLEAILSAYGFKLTPIEFNKLYGSKSKELERTYNNTRRRFYELAKQYREGNISLEQYENEVNKVYKDLEKVANRQAAINQKISEARMKKAEGDIVETPEEEEPVLDKFSQIEQNLKAMVEQGANFAGNALDFLGEFRTGPQDIIEGGIQISKAKKALDEGKPREAFAEWEKAPIGTQLGAYSLPGIGEALSGAGAVEYGIRASETEGLEKAGNVAMSALEATGTIPVVGAAGKVASSVGRKAVQRFGKTQRADLDKQMAELATDVDNDVKFISPTLKVMLERGPQKIKGDAILDWVRASRNKGVKPKEVEYLKIEDYVKANPEATFDEVIKAVSPNRVKIDKSVYQGGGNSITIRTDDIEYDPKSGNAFWSYRVDDINYYLKENDADVKEELVNFFRDNYFYDGPKSDIKNLDDVIALVDKGAEPSSANAYRDFNVGRVSSLDDLVEEYARAEYKQNPYQRLQTYSDIDGAPMSAYAIGNEELGFRFFKENPVTGRIEQTYNATIYDRNEASVQLRNLMDNEAQMSGVGTKFKTFIDENLPGGHNYKEVVYEWDNADKLAQREFREISEHYPAEEKYLFHTLTRDRSLDDGTQTLHIDELQSDLHQKGTKTGYATPEKVEELNKKLESYISQQFKLRNELEDLLYTKYSDELGEQPTEAIETLLDGITLFLHSPGGLQRKFERNLEEFKFTMKNKYSREALKNTDFSSFYSGGDELSKKILKQLKELQTNVADRYDVRSNLDDLVADYPFKDNWHEIGIRKILAEAIENGHGAISASTSPVLVNRWSSKYKDLYSLIYDKRIPSYMQKLARQYGGKFEKGKLDIDDTFEGSTAPRNENMLDVNILRITPEMRENILEKGLEGFNKGGRVRATKGGVFDVPYTKEDPADRINMYTQEPYRAKTLLETQIEELLKEEE